MDNQALLSKILLIFLLAEASFAVNHQLTLKSCAQSSTASSGVCRRAIDGNKSPNWSSRSCTHTKSEVGWWQATLKERSLVKYVRIYNRLDCCSDRLNDFTISVDGQECASYKSSGFFSAKMFRCNKVGHLIRINNRKSSPLSLCEVQVFGEEMKPKNQLQLVSCYQSSTSYGGVCQRAFDGKTNQLWKAGTCTHTNTEKGFWQATLKKVAIVNYVRIYNRLDCCSDRLNDFSILVDQQECKESYTSRKSFSVKTFRCEKPGQVLRIKNRINTPLTLCEVQVFGEYIAEN